MRPAFYGSSIRRTSRKATHSNNFDASFTSQKRMYRRDGGMERDVHRRAASRGVEHSAD
jgi:hypothetical protein